MKVVTTFVRSIGAYVYYSRKWAIAVIVPALLVGALMYIYTGRQPKIYEATNTLYVQGAQNSYSGTPGYADPYSNSLLAQTFSQMVTDPVVARQVDKMLAPRYPNYHVEGHGLSVAQRVATQESQLVTVQVQDTNPVRAADALNAVASVFISRIRNLERNRFAADEGSLEKQIANAQKQITGLTIAIAQGGSSQQLASERASLTAYRSTYNSLLQSLEQFRATSDSMSDSVSVYSPAVPPQSPVGPHPTRTALLAMVLAAILLGSLVVGYNYLVDLPRSLEEVEKIAGAPILGTVEQFEPGSSSALVKQATSSVGEAYRRIRTNIEFARPGHQLRTLLVSSSIPGEGKTTTAANLALAYSGVSQQVTLIDADLRRPKLHNLFNLDRATGLTNMLIAGQLNGVGIADTSVPNLRLVASGPVPPNPADLLGAGRMERVLGHLADDNSLTIIDSPPLLAVTDAAILATLVDGVILVLDPQRTRRRDLAHSREAIEAVGGTILGVVVNRVQRSSTIYYSYRGKYGYYGYYGPEAPNKTSRTEAGAGAGSSN